MEPLRASRITLFLASTALLLGLFGGVARASNPIEGIWSFGGGAVAIQATSGGAFQGTVVQATTFAVCEHPVSQVMWTGLRERSDGSFWGRHLWYHGANCEIDPNRGLTAFRVISMPGGQRVLLVCFSNPGDPSQPTIGPEGKSAGATYGCVESAPLSPLPGSAGSRSGRIRFGELLTLPSSKPPPICRRTLTLVPHNPKYDPLKRIVIWIAGKKVATITAVAKLHHKIVVRNLPEGRFRLKVRVVTVLKQRFTRTRVYRGCGQKVKLEGPRGPGHT